jgi:hypothetical protein
MGRETGRISAGVSISNGRNQGNTDRTLVFLQIYEPAHFNEVPRFLSDRGVLSADGKNNSMIQN